MHQAIHSKVGHRWGAQLRGTRPRVCKASVRLLNSGAWGRHSRGVGAGLVRAGAIHVQRDLLPFAAAVVGVQGVDGHLKLDLEAPSTPNGYEDPRHSPQGTVLPAQKRTDSCPAPGVSGFSLHTGHKPQIQQKRPEGAGGGPGSLFVPSPQLHSQRSVSGVKNPEVSHENIFTFS